MEFFTEEYYVGAWEELCGASGVASFVKNGARKQVQQMEARRLHPCSLWKLSIPKPSIPKSGTQRWFHAKPIMDPLDSFYSMKHLTPKEEEAKAYRDLILERRKKQGVNLMGMGLGITGSMALSYVVPYQLYKRLSSWSQDSQSLCCTWIRRGVASSLILPVLSVCGFLCVVIVEHNLNCLKAGRIPSYYFDLARE